MTRKTLSDDWDRYRDNPFWISNNVWNEGNLVNGQDFTQTIGYDTDHLTQNLRFSWSWPKAGNVLAYPEVIAGYKPWDAYGSDNLTAQINDLKTFDVSFDYSIGGQTSRFNVAFDLWLTGKPDGPVSSINTELMVWVHTPDFSPAGSIVGHYQHDGFSADIYEADNFGDASGSSHASWRYIAVKSTTEMRDADIDFAHLLKALHSMGLISGSDYVNGYEFGAELTGGSGHLTVHDIHHHFDETSHAAAAIDVPHHNDAFHF